MSWIKDFKLKLDSYKLFISTTKILTKFNNEFSMMQVVFTPWTDEIKKINSGLG